MAPVLHHRWGGYLEGNAYLLIDDQYFFWQVSPAGGFSYHPTKENVIISVGDDCITKSTNGGATFSWSNSGVNNFCPSGIHNLNPFNHNLLLVVGRDKAGAFSKDRGYTWTNAKPIQLGYGGGHGFSGYAMTEKILVAAGVDRDVDDKWKICVSENGGQSFHNTQILAAGERTVCPDPADPARVFLGAHKSDDYGQSWDRMTGADGVFTYNPTGDYELYGSNGTSVVRSYDHGLTWQTVVNTGEDIADIALDHETGKLYIAAGAKLFTCNTDGTGLTNITGETPADQFGNRNIKSVAVDPNHPSIVYVANATSYQMDNNMVRSTDGGQSWEIITRNTRVPNPQFGKDGGRMPVYVRVCPTTSEAYVGGGCFGLWKIGPPPEANPVVKILSPLPGSNVSKTATVLVEVGLFNNDDRVTRVKLMVNGEEAGELQDEPWQFSWDPAESGEHVLVAVGIDAGDREISSHPVRVQVLASELPVVSISSPLTDTEFEYGDTILIEADASDPDGTIEKVEFYRDSVLLGEVSSSPFFLTWPASIEGTHALTAAATDNSGQRVISSQVVIRVNEQPYSQEYLEDFGDGLAQQWTQPAGSWTVEGEQYRNESTGELEMSLYDGATFREYNYTARANPDGSGYFGLVYNYVDQENYLLAKVHVTPAIASLVKIEQGSETKIGQAYYPGSSTGEWFDLELMNPEGYTTLRINDSTILANLPTPYPDSGRIGLFTESNAGWFDDVHVLARYMYTLVGAVQPEQARYDIRVFPNPVSGSFLNVRITGDHDYSDIQVLDMTGRHLHSAPLQDASVAIPTRILGAPGVYLLRFTGKSGSRLEKVVSSGTYLP